jgi:hypothetical protein
MSMGGMNPAGGEVGQTVASFPTYEAAQKAVSALIAGEVPAREIVIIGIGIRSVERVTGRLGYAAAARSGAINGVLLGLFFAAVFVIGSPTIQIQAFVGVLFVGIAIGMLLNLLLYALMRRRRDYASVTQFVAERYEVNVAPGNLSRARDVLGRSTPVPPAAPRAAAPAAPAPAPAPAAPEAERPRYDEPPRYGQRIGEPSPAAPADDDAPEDGAEPAPPAGERPDRSE